MLEAGDILVAGQLVQIGAQQLGHDIPWQPFTILCLAILTLLNYRGVFATLTVNFVITAAAFLTIIILFIGVKPWAPSEVLLHKELLTELPYGWIGVIAALHFGIWYYLGIEGTCQAAEEVRSPGRALPLGTMSGMITLLIAAAITWYIACGLMPWEYIGWDATLAPLYDAARMTGSPDPDRDSCSSARCSRPSPRPMAASTTRRGPGSPWAATAICRNGSAPCIRATARPSARSCS